MSDRNFQHAALFSVLLLFSFAVGASAQQEGRPPKALGKFEISGKVRSVRPGKIIVDDGKGGRREILVQDGKHNYTTLNGFLVNLPATVEVTGVLPASKVEAGMVIKFQGQVNRAGRSKGEIKGFEVVDLPNTEWKVDPETKPKDREYVKCDIIGRVRYYQSKKDLVLLNVPKTSLTRLGSVKFKLDPESEFSIGADRLSAVRKGDKVIKITGVKFDTGEWVAKSVKVEMAPDREAATVSYHDQLELKFSSLSDEPGKPRTVGSRHFTLVTDISDRQASVLLAKLETMYDLLGKYYGRLNPRKIKCFVVRKDNLDAWAGAGLHPRGITKIKEGAGVTISLTDGKNAVSVVYSSANQGVVQHEAVHAICTQRYGDAGPTWYAEGMAEVGQYWKPGVLEVDIDPEAATFLTTTKEVKSLDEIVKAGQITGDSWEAYCWRWALCHMLANNPNYARTFKKLGIRMMQVEDEQTRQKNGVTFEAAYGNVKNEVQFEYQFFCKNFDNGYRVDLCAIDWPTLHAAEKLSRNDFAKAVVPAAGGWKATKVYLERGKPYEYITQGKWKIEKGGKELGAEGYEGGVGGMVAVVMKDYKLSKPFFLSEERGKFTAPQDGVLLLRCNDNWLELSDNEGEITTFFQRLKAEESDK